MNKYKIEPFPKIKIATFDICSVGMQMHQVAAMIEVDVSESFDFDGPNIKHIKNGRSNHQKQAEVS
jgi:hypothetical protein